MNKVFVVQESTRKDPSTGMLVPNMDLSPAAEYGSIRFLLPPGQVTLVTQPTLLLMRRRLREFEDGDYLLPIGDPVAIMLAGSVLAEFRKNWKVLKWDRRGRNYVEIEVER